MFAKDERVSIFWQSVLQEAIYESRAHVLAGEILILSESCLTLV